MAKFPDPRRKYKRAFRPPSAPSPRPYRPPLTPQHLRFVDEYTLSHDLAIASKASGVDFETGKSLFAKPIIQAAIQIAKQRSMRRTEIYTDEVLRRWWLLATADAREFTQIRRVNCRRCWGRNHQYQFRDNELIEAELEHEHTQIQLDEKQRYEFNDLGGGGFDGFKDPCRGPKAVSRLLSLGVDVEATSEHDCPACDGLGEVTVWVNDSRNYSPGAVLLYDGVKVSKEGSVEIKHRDRDEAMKMVAQHLGMLVTRNVNLELDPTKLTDEQLDQVLERFGHLAGREDGPLLEHAPAGEDAAG
jgi:hypothetical protein